MGRLVHPVPLFALLVGALVSLAHPVPAIAQQDGDVQRGREFARQHCTRCHVVGDINPMGGISSTPSFQLLVRRRPDYQYRFQTFFERAPHPAFVTLKGEKRIREDLPANAAPIAVTVEQIEDLAAYVETLKPDPNETQKPFAYSPRPKPRTE